MRERPLTFIVGTGRSGSTALSRIIRLHPEVLSLNEFFASLGDGALPRAPFDGEEFWRILTEPNAFFDRMTRSGAPLPEFLYIRRPGRYSAERGGIPALSLMVLPHLSDDPDGLLDAIEPEIRALPRSTAGQQYAALFDVLTAHCGGGPAVIERSGYSVGAIPRLRTAFPHARFVHLHRDGPDCALSMSRHVGYRSIAVLREVFRRSGIRSLGELTPERAGELPEDLAWLLRHRFDAALLLERPMPVAGFGTLWSQLVSEGAARLADLPPARHITLGYEDLLAAPHEELARLAGFAGVAPHPEWLAGGAALLDGARRGAALHLPPHELAELRERCAPGTRALAQARERERERERN